MKKNSITRIETHNMDIILYHHLGLGDHFICNALVVEVSKHYNNVHLVCWARNLPTVQHLYSDFPNITIHGIDTEPQDVIALSNSLGLPVIAVGFEHCDLKDFESSFYRQLGLDPDIQYTGFCVPRDLDRSYQMYNEWCAKNGPAYIFVHDTSSVEKYNLIINSDLPRYTVEKTQTRDLIDYVIMLCEAKEVHVINSSIAALVWPLLRQGRIKAEKIFYHNARSLNHGGVPIKIPQDPRVFIVES